MEDVQQVYNILYKKFGPQGWWPTSVRGVPRHHGLPPKNSKERFEIIIGAILTQNTNWNNVEKAIINLNKAKVLDINKISNIKQQTLAKLIRPSGYYNQKARTILRTTNYLLKTNNPTREELLNIKGIGPETADSILLYAFGKPYFVVDAYTKRIFSRLGILPTINYKLKTTYNELQNFLHKNLKKDITIFKEYHALLVKLGKDFCKTKPVCHDCPLKKNCNYLILIGLS